MQLKETLNRLCHANLQTLGKNTKGQRQQRLQYKSRAALASFLAKASWPKSARIVPTWRNNMMECPARLFAAPTCPVRQSDTLSTWTEFGIIENLGRRQECLSEQILAVHPSFPRAKLTRARPKTFIYSCADKEAAAGTPYPFGIWGYRGIKI